MATSARSAGPTIPRPTGTIRPAATARAASRGDDTVLVDLTQGRYFTLNGVGTRIWNLLIPGITFDELTATLADEYDAPPDVIAGDAARLLAQLQHAALITCE